MKACVLAYAKLNLSLEVCGRRSDGFHDIRSLVQTIDLADRIEITPGIGVRVSCTEKLRGPNIVEQATRVLLREKRSDAELNIWIEKNIPLGAGLGGGSSDAAAVLAIVNRLVPPMIAQSKLLEIAGSIGSDVPLFLTGGCMNIAGLGHPEQQLPLRPETFVLLVPDIHCSTGDIYNAWRAADTPSSDMTLGRNDLYPAAVSLYPRLESYRNSMNDVGELYSGMTGSGSAFFAAFPSRIAARLACEKLARQTPGCRVYCCQPTKSGFAEPANTGFATKGTSHEDRD